VNSKEAILRSIDSAKVPPFSHPGVIPGSGAAGSLSKFSELLISIGGELRTDISQAELSSFVLSTFGSTLDSQGSVIFCDNSIGALGVSELKEEESLEPKEFTLSILSGDFGVEENGAVWVRPKSLRARLALFSTEHLVLVMPNIIVPTMHEAYERINIQEGPTGYFIAGPSKTADIEQNLVIGAQAARSLLVIAF